MRTRKITLLTLTAAALFAHGAAAAIIEDFQFGDSSGTLLNAAANSVNASNLWSMDAVNQTASSIQSGSYQVKKNNDNLASNYLQHANITSGKGWLVAEMSGWFFSSIVGSAEFDAAELEEVRFAFLDNDTGTSGSTITAQATIQRTATGGLELVGRNTTGAPEIAGVALALNQSTPFTVVLEIDESAEQYSVYYKNGASPFTLLGPAAAHVAGRNGNSVRFAVNNNFGGTGEFFNIDRIYLTTDNPMIPEPASVILVGIAALGVFGRRRRVG